MQPRSPAGTHLRTLLRRCVGWAWDVAYLGLLIAGWATYHPTRDTLQRHALFRMALVWAGAYGSMWCWSASALSVAGVADPHVAGVHLNARDGLRLRLTKGGAV
eukprot:gene8569-25035_t